MRWIDIIVLAAVAALFISQAVRFLRNRKKPKGCHCANAGQGCAGCPKRPYEE